MMGGDGVVGLAMHADWLSPPLLVLATSRTLICVMTHSFPSHHPRHTHTLPSAFPTHR